MIQLIALIISLCLFSSCSKLVMLKPSYRSYYSYRSEQRRIVSEEKSLNVKDSSFVLFLVDAKHLDYSNCSDLLVTIAKHPDGSRRRDVGHAWIMLSWVEGNKRYTIEGGQSGEQPMYGPTYLDTIYKAAQSKNQENDPISFLFYPRYDGFFQKGNGGHTPTFAALKYISKEECASIKKLIDQNGYPFNTYSLLGSHCCSFIEKVAEKIDLDLTSSLTLNIQKDIFIRGERLTLYRDDKLLVVDISTPDTLEKKLVEATKRGLLLPALNLYKRKSFSSSH